MLICKQTFKLKQIAQQNTDGAHLYTQTHWYATQLQNRKRQELARFPNVKSLAVDKLHTFTPLTKLNVLKWIFNMLTVLIGYLISLPIHFLIHLPTNLYKIHSSMIESEF